MTQLKNSRCLEFRISDNKKAYQIRDVLKNNNIDFVDYFEGLDTLFRVAKSDKKWNEIMALINSIKAPKYRYINTCIEKGVEYEIIKI